MTPGPDGPSVPDHLPSGLEIRVETRADRPAVAAVVAAAFGSPTEAGLVEAIRASPEFLPELSLVADVGRQVAGHVMISHATIRDGEVSHRIAMLSPLAVAPQFQRRGVGSALVREVTRRADDSGEPLVVLEGNPVFYGRLGFEYSVPYGIHLTLPSWAPAEASQVLRLRNYTPSIRGLVIYPAAFDEVADD
jgi:putative acetyltransferase